MGSPTIDPTSLVLILIILAACVAIVLFALKAHQAQEQARQAHAVAAAASLNASAAPDPVFTSSTTTTTTTAPASRKAPPPPMLPEPYPGEGLFEYAKRVGVTVRQDLDELRVLAKHHPGATWAELVDRALHPADYMTQADRDTLKAAAAASKGPNAPTA